MLSGSSKINTDHLEDELFVQKQISLSVIRLDMVNPIVSGNKLFKLHYFLQDAQRSIHQTVLTFGGAYSNHLVATAYACKLSGVKSIGIVRGERPSQLSHTLQHCMEFGMQLKFVTRADYAKKENIDYQDSLAREFGECTIIPEGGYHPTGARGAALIMDSIDATATHICCALGTATTICGLLPDATQRQQQVVAVPVVKGMTDIDDRIAFLLSNRKIINPLKVLNDYHFGGYAKYTAELISFMNKCYQQYQLPTDFVYTAKMLFAIFDTIKKDGFPAGSKITCLHTGGLQGNLSLPPGTLIF